MANENIFAAVEALGDQILQYKRYAEDQDAQIKYLNHEIKEYQSIVCELERELKEERERAELMQRNAFMPCVNCAYFDIVDGVRKCFKWGRHFPEGGIADPLFFGCNKWESRAGVRNGKT